MSPWRPSAMKAASLPACSGSAPSSAMPQTSKPKAFALRFNDCSRLRLMSKVEVRIVGRRCNTANIVRQQRPERGPGLNSLIPGLGRARVAPGDFGQEIQTGEMGGGGEISKGEIGAGKPVALV